MEEVVVVNDMRWYDIDVNVYLLAPELFKQDWLSEWFPWI